MPQPVNVTIISVGAGRVYHCTCIPLLACDRRLLSEYVEGFSLLSMSYPVLLLLPYVVACVVYFVSNVPFAANCCHIFFLPPYVIMYSLHARYASLEKKLAEHVCKTIPKCPEPTNWDPDHQKWPPLLTLDVTNDFWYQKNGSAFRAWTSQTRLQ